MGRDARLAAIPQDRGPRKVLLRGNIETSVIWIDKVLHDGTVRSGWQCEKTKRFVIPLVFLG